LTRRIVISGVLALALGGLLLLAIAQRGKPEISVERNLVYGKGGDTDLLLDLAMPKSGAGRGLQGRRALAAGERREVPH